MRSAIRIGIPINIEFRILSQDGQVRWVAAKGQPFDQNDTKSAVINGLFTDVTALKEAEQEAELHRMEVTHLMRQSVLNELSGTIAHELNQPLTAIMSNAEAAQDLLSDQKGRGKMRVILGKIGDILKDIMAEDERAADVISRVRQLLKKADSKRETISINELIESTLALLHGEFVKRKIVVDVDCAPRLPSVSVDFVQLQQVLINLIVNAMDAMTSVPPIEREIRIRAFSEGDQVKIVISDKGHGLTEDIRKKLFQPFVTTKEQGLGLGLSICGTILKAHSGKISVENSADRGATAILTLPAQDALVPAQ